MNRLLRRSIGIPLASILLFGLATLPAAADVFVVSPGAEASTEGNSDNGFPFNLSPLGITSMRYQQVYNASDFSALGGPMLITEIAFRPDAFSGQAFSSTLPNVQIDLSTTSKSADTLSPTFADNVGSNDTIVHSGSLQLSSAFTGPAGGPKAFDIVINLTTPFLYDPSAGNLLLDVRNFSGGATTQFDAEFAIDSSSRAFAANDVNSASGSTDTGALITEFGFVPEPSSYVLLGTFCALAALRSRRTPNSRNDAAE